MRKDIRVSFKDNPDEDQLYDDIIAECNLIGKSAWMKIAAREKLERNCDSSKSESSKPQRINMSNNQVGIINSFDDIFPQ